MLFVFSLTGPILFPPLLPKMNQLGPYCKVPHSYGALQSLNDYDSVKK